MSPEQQIPDREEQLRQELIEQHGIHNIVQPSGSLDAPDLFELGIFDEETTRLIEELERQFSDDE